MANMFGDFSYLHFDVGFIATNHIKASVPIWFLIVLVTLFTALLHLLARRHFRTKASPAAEPPAPTS